MRPCVVSAAKSGAVSLIRGMAFATGFAIAVLILFSLLVDLNSETLDTRLSQDENLAKDLTRGAPGGFQNCLLPKLRRDPTTTALRREADPHIYAIEYAAAPVQSNSNHGRNRRSRIHP